MCTCNHSRYQHSKVFKLRGQCMGNYPAVRLQHVVPLGLRLLVDGVVGILLHVRVHDGHHLAPAARHVLNHALRGGEHVLVPRHVPLAVRVLDVQPQHVVRDVVLVEPRVHLGHVVFVAVVPAALVVPQRELRGHLCRAGDCGVLAQHGRGGGAGDEEEVHGAALRHPVRVRLRLVPRRAGPLRHLLRHVYVRLRGVVEVDGGGDRPATSDRPQRVRQHHGDGPVQPEGALVQVLEHVEVVQAVGLRRGRSVRAALGLLEAHGGGALGDAVHVVRAGEGHVEGDGHGAVRAAVGVRVEGLGPRLALRRRLLRQLHVEEPARVEHHRLHAAH
mmetsp:Transcript_28749/g.70877  ORF Transcript_28749/g.70877 Transcript_28749/m.70877 type:complete len:331 (-) Transcript_28749:873-1865(-)